jgi:RimJ/RimL family protein N-acetyltransferase
VDWPLTLPERLSDGTISVSYYDSSDAEELFRALDDVRVWEHIPHLIPTTPAVLNEWIGSRLAAGDRSTFTIRDGTEVVGMTSILFDPSDPDGVEIGGTQLSTSVWGTGLNGAVKRLLIARAFDSDAAWIQFRTDERNHRSAAAISKLGARDLGIRQDVRVRRDGSVRRSRFFRLEPDTRTTTFEQRNNLKSDPRRCPQAG